MNDIDLLLSIVENPTRRRILESLVREPSYPLRLSKELGISQQAVMKNLTLMEQNGLVSSSRMDSNMGPMRIVYTPNSEFTLVVEMHSSLFSAKVISPSAIAVDGIEDMTGQEARDRVEEIDRRIEEIDRERSELMAERNAIIGSHDASDGENITIEEKEV